MQEATSAGSRSLSTSPADPVQRRSLVKAFLSPNDPCKSPEGSAASMMPSSSQHLGFWQEGRRASARTCHWEQFCQQHFNIQVILIAAGTRSAGNGNKNSFIKQITFHLHILCIKAHTWMLTLKTSRVQVWPGSNKENSKQQKKLPFSLLYQMANMGWSGKLSTS